MYSPTERHDLKQIGQNIRRLRKERGYSQESFADAIELHRTYMGAWNAASAISVSSISSG